jgi:FAD/FMN-containing dehydrogenase
VLEMGFVPYKTPVWAVRRLEELAGPELVGLQRRLKNLMDPNNILNPGRWGAPE